jgi:hypothetical protein
MTNHGLKPKILELRSRGLSYKQIKAELGCSMATISFHCSPDQPEKVLQRARDRRNKNIAYLQQIKQDSGCVDCGEKYPYFVLDFDHVRGEKRGNLGQLVRQATLVDIKAEVTKCDIVCSNCHRFRTWNRKLKGQGDILDLEEFYG